MKFRLLGQHVLADGRLLEEGTEVGDDTGIPWEMPDGSPMAPSNQMEGLDAEGQKVVKELHQKLYGSPPVWDIEPHKGHREAREKEAKAQEKLDEGSKPVSRQQKYERDFAEELEDDGFEPAIPPGPARQPSHTARAAPTKGGDTRPAAGVAKPDTSGPVRPTKPNEEQYPKG